MKRLPYTKCPAFQTGSCFMLIIVISMLIGCKTANYGRYKVNREVEKLFNSGQVLADHTYYYTGSNTRPEAVMGIQKNYILDEELWNKAGDIQKNLKFWVEQMNNNLSATGYDILAPDGKQIGIYYTPWSTGPVKMGENNQVIIFLPEKESHSRQPRGK